LFQDEEDEYKKAKTNFKLLYSSESPLLQGTEEIEVTRDKYAGWRDTVSARCHDVLEYRRLANEVKSLETKVGDMEEKLLDSCRQLQNDKSSAEDLVEEVDKLRSLLNSANHWAEDARKIATKRTQVKEKEIDFAITGGVDTRGRDLQTLQREMDQRQEEREQLNTKVRPMQLTMDSISPIVFLTKLSTGWPTEQRIERSYDAYQPREWPGRSHASMLDCCSQFNGFPNHQWGLLYVVGATDSSALEGKGKEIRGS
jgi:predicted  nucleic acid-binding Zn-ribbon protein